MQLTENSKGEELARFEAKHSKTVDLSLKSRVMESMKTWRSNHRGMQFGGLVKDNERSMPTKFGANRSARRQVMSCRRSRRFWTEPTVDFRGFSTSDRLNERQTWKMTFEFLEIWTAVTGLYGEDAHRVWSRSDKAYSSNYTLNLSNRESFNFSHEFSSSDRIHEC